jgi:multiple sugar transport system substrate-binding protein
MPEVSRKARATALVLAASTATALLATACTGQSDSGASDDASKETTINFWHAWSAPEEVKAVRSLITGFEKAHPNIHVHVVGNMTDDKINQALRAGGDKAPDVISSFTTNNVGKFCSSGALVDLNPFFKKSDIDPEQTFPKAMNDPVRRQPLHGTPARRRLRPLLQQDGLRAGGHQGAAQDLVGVRGGRQEADDPRRRRLPAARFHA